jgi:hypothetical protein
MSIQSFKMSDHRFQVMQSMRKFKLFCSDKLKIGQKIRWRWARCVENKTNQKRSFKACLHEQQNLVAPCCMMPRDTQIGVVLIWLRGVAKHENQHVGANRP